MSKLFFDILIILILFLFALIVLQCHLNKESFEDSEIPQLKKGEYPNVIHDLKTKYLDKYQGDGTYKRLPFKFNTKLLSDDKDEGVLKNFRINTYLNTQSIELTYSQLLKILEKIIKDNDYKLKIDFDKVVKENKLHQEYLHKLISEKIVSLINNYFDKLELQNTYQKGDTRKFKIKEKKIISDTEIQGKTEDNRLLIFNLTFYKEEKDYHFTIQIDCMYNYILKTLFINELNIIGIQENEKIAFQYTYPIEQKHCILDNKSEKNPQLSYCHPQKMLDNKKNLMNYEDHFNKKELPAFYQEKKDAEKRDEEFKKYKCFYKNGFNKSTCESYSFQKNVFGVWDKPCSKNEECPFYKGNLNYNNERGGCVKGYCEMPENIKRRGYRYYDTSIPPFCHGCGIKGCLGNECFTCCDEQSDRKIFPSLKSPDYIFSNDNR